MTSTEVGMRRHMSWRCARGGAAVILALVATIPGHRDARATDCTPRFYINPNPGQVGVTVWFSADRINLASDGAAWGFSGGSGPTWGWELDRVFDSPGWYGASMGAWTDCGDYRESDVQFFYINPAEQLPPKPPPACNNNGVCEGNQGEDEGNCFDCSGGGCYPDPSQCPPDVFCPPC